MLDLQIGEGVFCILGDEIRHPVGVHRGGGVILEILLWEIILDGGIIVEKLTLGDVIP